MTTYKIYQHSDGSIEPVKVGWTWLAFLSAFMWTAWKKLWCITILSLVFLLVVGFAALFSLELTNGYSIILMDLAVLFLLFTFGKNALCCCFGVQRVRNARNHQAL